MPDLRVSLCRQLAIFMVAGVGLLLCAPLAKAQGPLAGLAHCQAENPLSTKGQDAGLARGFNLPNWDPGHNGLKPDDLLLSQLRTEGFSHIRLPIDGEKLMTAFSGPKEIKAYLDHLEDQVIRLHGLGFSLSLDMHPGGRFQTLHLKIPAAGLKLLTQAWELIAARAKSWPKAGIYFELLNEPVPAQEVWWPQAQSLVTLLNETAKGRGLIVGPAVYQRYEPLLDADPLIGQDLIYAIHYYDPFPFTHQAMTWGEGSYLSRIGQLPFPADANHPALMAQIKKLEQAGDTEAVADLRQTFAQPWDAARVSADFAPVGAWSKRHNVAVIVNEFGVLNFDVDKWARTDWLRAVRQAAEEHCLGWTHWEFSNGFGMVDPQTTLIDPFVLDALMSQNSQ
ncbi:glycoside hydrolase family 5 protein [Cohaesibacter celericrescens]|nr:cellulase family glycosylhydrolase [Cohaesibacter celericrescens]